MVNSDTEEENQLIEVAKQESLLAQYRPASQPAPRLEWKQKPAVDRRRLLSNAHAAYTRFVQARTEILTFLTQNRVYTPGQLMTPAVKLARIYEQDIDALILGHMQAQLGLPIRDYTVKSDFYVPELHELANRYVDASNELQRYKREMQNNVHWNGSLRSRNAEPYFALAFMKDKHALWYLEQWGRKIGEEKIEDLFVKYLSRVDDYLQLEADTEDDGEQGNGVLGLIKYRAAADRENGYGADEVHGTIESSSRPSWSKLTPIDRTHGSEPRITSPSVSLKHDAGQPLAGEATPGPATHVNQVNLSAPQPETTTKWHADYKDYVSNKIQQLGKNRQRDRIGMQIAELKEKRKTRYMAARREVEELEAMRLVGAEDVVESAGTVTLHRESADVPYEDADDVEQVPEQKRITW